MRDDVEAVILARAYLSLAASAKKDRETLNGVYVMVLDLCHRFPAMRKLLELVTGTTIPPPTPAAAETAPKYPHPGTCAICKRPFATVEDYRNLTIEGKCSTWYAYRDEESFDDCRRAAAAITGGPK